MVLLYFELLHQWIELQSERLLLLFIKTFLIFWKQSHRVTYANYDVSMKDRYKLIKSYKCIIFIAPHLYKELPVSKCYDDIYSLWVIGS